MAGFQNRAELADMFFVDSSSTNPALDKALGLGPWYKGKERFQGFLARVESLTPKLVKQPQLVRQKRRRNPNSL